MNYSTQRYELLLPLLIVFLLLYWYASAFVTPFSNPEFFYISYASVLLFWVIAFAAALLLFRHHLPRFATIIKNWKWAGVFTAYLTVHLFVYGLLLEKIFVTAYGYPLPFQGNYVYVSFVTFYYPHTLLNALIEILENPTIVIVSGVYGIALSAYALMSAFIIGMLVVLHLHFLSKAAPSFRRAGATVLYPTVGVVAGASCCISLPELLINYTAVSAAILGSALLSNTLIVLYFVLPAAVMFSFAITLPR